MTAAGLHDRMQRERRKVPDRKHVRPIEEYRGSSQAPELNDVVGHDRPGGAGSFRDWPPVQLAGQSDTAFARKLADRDSGAEVDALLMPADQGGLIGYNDASDGFNHEHHRVAITPALQRLATYSRQQDPPGLAMQSALVSSCIPGFLDVHSLPFLTPAIQPGLWVGNQVFDE